MHKLIIPAALLLASSSAFAQQQQQQQQHQPLQQQAQAKAKPRLICHDVGETGSRLTTHRICMTADQWKDQQDRDRENVGAFQRQSTIPQ